MPQARTHHGVSALASEDDDDSNAIFQNVITPCPWSRMPELLSRDGGMVEASSFYSRSSPSNTCVVSVTKMAHCPSLPSGLLPSRIGQHWKDALPAKIVFKKKFAHDLHLHFCAILGDHLIDIQSRLDPVGTIAYSAQCFRWPEFESSIMVISWSHPLSPPEVLPIFPLKIKSPKA